MKSTALLSLGTLGAAVGTGSVALAVATAILGLTVILVVAASARAVVVVSAKTGCGALEAAESVAVVVRSALGRHHDPGEASRSVD